MKLKEVITVEGMKKTYQKKRVLEDISLQIAPGECIGILGGNGSGKSTLLSILAGVQKPDEGRFWAGNEDLLRSEGMRSKLIGYVPQEPPLMEELTGRDNLLLWYDRPSMEWELENGVLAILGVGEFLKTPVRKMSGGMKKRLVIGCAAAGNPGLLLLDEPSAALDLICKERIANYLREYKAEGGAILLATHDMHEMELCDKWFIIKDGKLMPYQYDGDIKRLVGLL